jgi:hypothetical protein
VVLVLESMQYGKACSTQGSPDSQVHCFCMHVLWCLSYVMLQLRFPVPLHSLQQCKSLALCCCCINAVQH